MATHGRGFYESCIWVWRYPDAIAHLRDFLPAGRTGTWVVLVPPQADGPDLKWIRALGPLVSRHPLTDGDVCYVVGEAA